MNEPILFDVEQWYLKAFYELITGRNSDGRISWKDLNRYAAESGLEDDLIPAFKYIMRELERTFAGWMDRQRKKEQEAARRDAQQG